MNASTPHARILWVTGSYDVLFEYAHGASSPSAILSDPLGATSCSVDPTTGNIATVNNFLSDEVAIFKHAAGTAEGDCRLRVPPESMPARTTAAEIFSSTALLEQRNVHLPWRTGQRRGKHFKPTRFEPDVFRAGKRCAMGFSRVRRRRRSQGCRALSVFRSAGALAACGSWLKPS